jgi:hypothetical protein
LALTEDRSTMPRLTNKPPVHSLHKTSGQARVRLGGREIYLGVYGTPESRREYGRVVGEWLAAGRRPPARSALVEGSHPGPDCMTVAEMIAAYWRFVDTYYVKGEEPTSEVGNIRPPPRYEVVRARPRPRVRPADAQDGQGDHDCRRPGSLRKEINKRVGRIVRAFKWGVENELVPPDVNQAH